MGSASSCERGASPRTDRPAATGRRLEEAGWRSRLRAHEERLRPFVEPALVRRSRHEADPIGDFLFEYYAVGPGQLLRWSPGAGTILLGDEARALLDCRGFEEREGGVGVGSFPARRRPFLVWLRSLCTALADRPPFLGCSGMHEWAMVYRSAERRHPRVPLRLAPEEIAEVLETLGLPCTHFDASRFFTPAARPLQRRALARETTLEHEQPGCLHCNMDLFRWAFKLFPWSSGELVADAFFLALAIREVDMRASPYDLRAFGREPIRVETEDGRREYREHQVRFAAAAAPIRSRILELAETLLAG